MPLTITGHGTLVGLSNFAAPTHLSTTHTANPTLVDTESQIPRTRLHGGQSLHGHRLGHYILLSRY